ncbi:MAG TPA: alpha/beta hydrolase, partial [Polyangiaceae bacterium]|nr:alpha/beta hydrolase [Polyangiaceae bacterium]
MKRTDRTELAQNRSNSRRNLLLAGAAMMTGACAPGALSSNQPVHQFSTVDTSRKGKRHMGTITTQDGTQLYYKDWGSGRPIVFSHGWPLSSDSWESQMLFLAEHGFRCIAHDRRGHGRSSQPWSGNDMNTYADDLARVIESLNLEQVTLVGFSTGGGEVTRYIGRHGTKRVRQAVLVSAIPPLMLKTPHNPAGTPKEVFDGLRAASIADRSKLYRDLASGPFFGFNRPGAQVSQGMIDSFWLQGMQSGHKNAYDCI